MASDNPAAVALLRRIARVFDLRLRGRGAVGARRDRVALGAASYRRSPVVLLVPAQRDRELRRGVRADDPVHLLVVLLLEKRLTAAITCGP